MQPPSRTYFDLLPCDLLFQLSRHIVRHKLSETSLNFLLLFPLTSTLSAIPERFKTKNNLSFSSLALNHFSGSIRRISLHSTSVSLQNFLSALSTESQTISADALLQCSPKFFRTREWLPNNTFHISDIRSMNLYLDSCTPEVVDQTLQLLHTLPLEFLELLCTGAVHTNEEDVQTCPLRSLTKDVPRFAQALGGLDTLYLNGRSCSCCRMAAENEEIQLYADLLPLLPDIEEVGVRWNVSDNELVELRKVERLSIARFYRGFETAMGLGRRVVELRCRERILNREQLQALEKCDALETLSVMVQWEDRETLIGLLPKLEKLDDMYLEWVRFDEEDQEEETTKDVMPRILRAGSELQYFGVAGYFMEKGEVGEVVREGFGRLRYLKIHLKAEGIVGSLEELMRALRKYGRGLGELAVRCDFVGMVVKEGELRNLRAGVELVKATLPQLGLGDVEGIVEKLSVSAESEGSDVEME